MSDFNRELIAEFRANDGKVTGMFAESPLMVLTTRGAKSGEPREHPLVYTTDGERIVVIASKGGAPTNPAWYYNLVANPEVTVELPGRTFQARAVVIEGEERQRLFDAQAAVMPGFADYQRKTTRQIPVVALEPIE
jgi:deazaflavin-dependent oxidoreductase (nitroreductase family)